MSKDIKIAFAGCKNTTKECLDHFLKLRKVDYLISIDPTMGSREKVAGYENLSPFAKSRNIQFISAQSYSLKDKADQTLISSLGIDLLLVIGWQRLIPEWFLNSLSIGAFGMHGSPEPLPKGRGRSPMNWALANGKQSFITNLFRYDAGIDSGDIVESFKFDINAWDDANTLHLKNTMAMCVLIEKNLVALIEKTKKFIPQDRSVEPTYFPKRSEEDGRIRWANHDMSTLHNHIRCQTKPFPGAFSHYDGSESRTYFWKGQPFDSSFRFSQPPGTIVKVFSDSSFLVSVSGGSVLITEYESADNFSPVENGRFFDEPKNK